MRLPKLNANPISALTYPCQPPPPPTLEANSPPAAPSSVTLTRADGTVTASWPEVSNAASYHVTYSSDGENSWTAAPCGNNCTVGNNGVAVNEGIVSITISGVDNAKTYVVGVRASDNGGQWSGWTNSAAIAPQLPAAPSSVTLSRAAGQLTVTWTAVSAATSYNINISGDGTNSWTRAVSGATGAGNTITKTIDSGIDNWRWYIAGVQAVNDKGAGGWMNSDFVAPIYSPGPVGNLSAERSGTGISVTWNAPDNNGGSAVTGYDVNYTLDGVHSWTRVSSNQSATSATISNADNAVDYVVAVRANNGVGEGGAWTNSAPVAGLAGPATVSAVKSGDYIDGAWSAVAGATGYDVNLLYFQNEYHYRIETNMTGTSRRIYINDGSDFSPEQFVIAVRARNAHGPGAWVNSPPAAANPSLTVSNLTANTATLTLFPYAGTWYYQANTGPDSSSCQGPVTTASKDIAGLTPVTSYTYTAYSDSGCSTALDAAPQFTTQGVSVSNLNESGANSCGVGNFGGVSSGNFKCATSLAMGSGAASYTLHSVTAGFLDKQGNPGTFTMALHADSGGSPAASAVANASFSGSDPDSAGNHEYTCSGAGCSVWGSTTYWLVLSAANNNGSHNYKWRVTISDNETTVPSSGSTVAGWSIGNTGKNKLDNNAWADLTGGISGTFKVVALENPTLLTATSLTATTATLAIGNYNLAWWYQRTIPSGDATCHSVTAGTTTDTLTGLTSGTSYTYKAYDKSGCASADEIVSLTFTQVTPPGSRDSSKDFNTLSAAGNTSPDGIWSDGTTMWVSDATDVKVYAYNLATKARDDSKDVSLSGTVIPVTLGSDGTTMWVADVITTSKLFAYSISGKSRDASKDITLHTDNANTFGLWSNGTTIWVGDGTDDYIYAYTISTGTRDTGKEIDLHSDNDKVGGLWSDGVTMWVSDHDDDKLYAYNLSDGSRIAAKDYNSLDSQSDLVYGIWSDGTTMWVADNTTDKLYAYHVVAP